MTENCKSLVQFKVKSHVAKKHNVHMSFIELFCFVSFLVINNFLVNFKFHSHTLLNMFLVLC